MNSERIKMIHKYFFVVVFFFCSCTSLLAQLENTDNSIQFGIVEDDYKAPEGYELPAIKAPSLINPKDFFTPDNFSDLGIEKSDLLDITFEEEFIDVKTNTAPKYFTKDKAVSEEYGTDQYLGEIKTTSGSVTIMYRDHEYVDGDRVRIFVNGDVVVANVYLTGSFKGFTFPLQSGFNKVEFQALNQGSSGPNTAELQIYDEEGNILSSNQWNLTTGRKATATIIKE